MTHDELRQRIQAICDEFGLDLEEQTVEDGGKVEAEVYGFQPDQVDALNDEQKERLAQLRHELLVDATGTRVVFSVREFEPGNHNVDPDATEAIKREYINLEIDSETLRDMVVLASVGTAMLGQGLGRKVDPMKLQSMLFSEFPSSIEAQKALSKIEETVSIIEREHRAFHNNRAAEELAAFVSDDKDLFVSDITGEEG